VTYLLEKKEIWMDRTSFEVTQVVIVKGVAILIHQNYKLYFLDQLNMIEAIGSFVYVSMRDKLIKSIILSGPNTDITCSYYLIYHVIKIENIKNWIRI